MIPSLGKFSLKAHVEGSQSSQIGAKWADTVTLPNLFLSQLWDVEQWDSTVYFSLYLEASPLHWPVNLSSCLWLWANQYWNLSSVLINRVGCNSPGSCCPAESWSGCCGGWTTGRVLLWCGEPLRFLTGLTEFREEGPVLLEWWLKSTEAQTVSRSASQWLSFRWAH